MLKSTLPHHRGLRRCLAILTVAALAALGTTARANLAWGAEGHGYGPNITLDQQMTLMQNLGMTWYRVDCNTPGEFSYLASVIAAANRHGIKVMPVISDIGVDLANGTETYIYGQAYTFAQQIAQQFRGQVTAYQCGNEEEQSTMVQPGETMDNGMVWAANWGDSPGDSIFDYIAARYDRMRGFIRGLSDGIHSTDSNARTVVNTAGWFHYGFLQRLVNDGVSFDILGYDWYSAMGNIENTAPNALGVGTNIAAQLQLFGKPIWITEFNDSVGSQNSTTEQASSAIGTLANMFLSISGKYGIQTAMVYELADEPGKDNNSYEADMGIVAMNQDSSGNLTLGSPKPAYYTLQNILSANGVTANGSVASLANSQSDFSGSQGTNGWTYGYYSPNQGFLWLPTFEAQGGSATDSVPQWTDSSYSWLMITAGDQHPSFSGASPIPAVRRWTSTYTGTVEIKGTFQAQTTGGDGVGVGIVVGGQSYFRQLIGSGQSSSSYTFDVTAAVQQGTPIDFVVDPGPATNILYDAAALSATITPNNPARAISRFPSGQFAAGA